MRPANVGVDIQLQSVSARRSPAAQPRKASHMARNALPKIDHLSLNELNALIEKAQGLREARKEDAKTEFMDRMRKEAAAAGLSFDALMGRHASGRRKRSDAGIKLKPKYVGPNGETYTGRGPTPKWLKDLEAKGAKREKFLVKG